MSHNKRSQFVDWLIFLEDPGAVTYSYLLPGALLSEGIVLRVLASGHAVKLLASKGVVAEQYEDGVSEEDILNSYQPALVIVGTSENPDSKAFGLIAAARRRGLPTVGIVDGAMNVAERFRGNENHSLSWAPDWLIVPDESTAKGFIDLGFESSKIQVCNHPQYDAVLTSRNQWTVQDRRNQREKLLENSGGRPVLLFVSESSTGLKPSQYRRSTAYTLHGQPHSSGRTEIVLDEFLLAVKQLEANPFLVLRLHPKQQPAELGDYLSAFDQISINEPALELVNASDAVVGMTSMLLIEATLLGRPVLSLIPKPDERSWLGDMASVIPCVWEREELLRWLPLILSAEMPENSQEVPRSNSRALTKVISFLMQEFTLPSHVPSLGD